MKPIAFFPFHYEVSKTCGIGFVVARLRDQVEVLGCIWPRSIQLLLHHFDLSIEHLAGEPVDGDVYPVMLFTFDNKIVLETRSI